MPFYAPPVKPEALSPAIQALYSSRMLTLAAAALTIGLDLLSAEQVPQTPVPAVFISKEEHEKVLAEQTATRWSRADRWARRSPPT